jgi:hypothetical protein
MVIDSFTHEWRGEGGILEWHDSEVETFARAALKRNPDLDEDLARERQNMRAWIAPKRAHRSMVGAFLQRRMPMIFCIRAEDRVKVGPGGKPSPAGWVPQTNLDFMYDLTCSLVLGAERPGRVNLSLPKKIMQDFLPFLSDDSLLDEGVGAKFREWLGNLPKEEPKTNGQEADPETKLQASIAELIAAIEGKPDEASLNLLVQSQDVQARLTWLSVNRLADYERVAHSINQRQIAFRYAAARAATEV